MQSQNYRGFRPDGFLRLLIVPEIKGFIVFIILTVFDNSVIVYFEK
jgi:hypothetical protein